MPLSTLNEVWMRLHPVECYLGLREQFLHFGTNIIRSNNRFTNEHGLHFSFHDSTAHRLRL